MESFKDLKDIGLCIKSKDLVVQYQNQRCETICGNQLGKKCDKGCVLKTKEGSTESIFKNGFKLHRSIEIDGKKIDIVFFESDTQVFTLLQDNQEAIDNQVNHLLKFGLTPREQEIMHLFLEGKSNLEIITLLFISKSTLRTHLNNIYKKIPAEFKSDILACHFSKDNK